MPYDGPGILVTRKTRRPPSWWVAVLVPLLVLWVSVTVYYKRGASGIAFGGSEISFERRFDFALFRIDDRAALLVNRGGSMATVAYGRGVFPFCLLCGTYRPEGSIVNLTRYYKDGWLYTDHLGGPFAELYHVPTGEQVQVARPPGVAPGATGAQGPDPTRLPEYASRGLTFDPAHAITPALIQEQFPELRAINESCVVFTAAFVILVGLWLIVGLILVLRGRLVHERPAVRP